MPSRIEIDRLHRLIGEAAQLVEVLPQAEYSEAHLPGAINVPLKTLDGQTTAGLERDRAIVVYCHDYL